MLWDTSNDLTHTNTMRLDIQQNNVMAMMVSLQRRLDHRSDGDRERQFFSRLLRYLIATSGRQMEVEHWMITSYDVEFGPQIGSGGLCVIYWNWSWLYFLVDSEFKTAGRCSWGLGIRPKLR